MDSCGPPLSASTTTTITELHPDPEANTMSNRAEIDTSAPFHSVKEAVTLFGGGIGTGIGIGIGISNRKNFTFTSSSPPPPPPQHEIQVPDVAEIQEQAAHLEKQLLLKERETLEVLKQLDTTKSAVEQLKLNLQEEAFHAQQLSNATLDSNSDTNTYPLCPSSTPGFILMELKQAKFNLTRTTNDLAHIRSTVESYTDKIHKERMSLENTRHRLSSTAFKVSSLEEEINQTRQKLNLAEITARPGDISVELHRLSSETEEFVKIGEAAKLEVLKAMDEIEETKNRIKTVEVRLIAAKKMKEAARATEAVALADIKALSRSDTPSSVVTLSFEEYTYLKLKAREAEEECRKRVMDAVIEVDEANVSREEVLGKVEEATEEVKSSKRVLQDALNRVESANRGKLAVEEALRKWRSEHGQKRRSVQNSTKFKNSSCVKREPRLVDLNGMDLVKEESPLPMLRPTLSIGQILSRKLLLTEELEKEKSSVRRKVSLGQMLSKTSCDADDVMHPVRNKGVGGGGDKENSEKQVPGKRKKFGFGRIPILVAKQNKKKRQMVNSRRSSG